MTGPSCPIEGLHVEAQLADRPTGSVSVVQRRHRRQDAEVPVPDHNKWWDAIQSMADVLRTPEAGVGGNGAGCCANAAAGRLSLRDGNTRQAPSVQAFTMFRAMTICWICEVPS